MPKLKQSPVIYLSRADWSNIVTAAIKRAGIVVDVEKYEAAMNWPQKKLIGYPVVVDDSLPSGEFLMLGFGPGRSGYENQIKVIIRNSAKAVTG